MSGGSFGAVPSSKEKVTRGKAVDRVPGASSNSKKRPTVTASDPVIEQPTKVVAVEEQDEEDPEDEAGSDVQEQSEGAGNITVLEDVD
jgi:hypothetical protein